MMAKRFKKPAVFETLAAMDGGEYLLDFALHTLPTLDNLLVELSKHAELAKECESLWRLLNGSGATTDAPRWSLNQAWSVFAPELARKVCHGNVQEIHLLNMDSNLGKKRVGLPKVLSCFASGMPAFSVVGGGRLKMML